MKGIHLESKYGESNKDFAKSNVAFQAACAKANIAPTARQASKFRNKRGAAYGSKL